MIIANPIYDVVFKYLMEDLDIARDFLSLIIGEEIISLIVKPQESIVEVSNGMRVFRYDFKAVIKQSDGSHKKILIELQKAKVLLDVTRFRQYLGDNYSKDDQVLNDATGKIEGQSLPIITIYFLGFKLAYIPTAALKVGRNYIDLLTGQVFLPIEKEQFVEQLTHDCYMIQLPRLKTTMKTRLERVLQLFNQIYKLQTDSHKLNYEADPKEHDALVEKMMARLTRAVASDEVRLKMRIEDELERTYHKDMRAKDEIIEEKDHIIEKKDQQIAHLVAKTEQTAREMTQLQEQNQKAAALQEQTTREMAEMREQMALLMQQLSKK
jgi:hypothetical protein